MSEHGDTAATFKALVMFAERAQSQGLALVYNAFEEYMDDDGHPSLGNCRGDTLTGVCVLAAYSATCAPDEVLALPVDSDEMAAAWDGIEHGWDGGPTRHTYPAQWVAVGDLLRVKFQPRAARTP